MSSKMLGLIFLCSITMIAGRKKDENISFSIIPMVGFEKYFEDVTLLSLDKLKNKPNQEKVDVKKSVCASIFSNAVMLKLKGVHAVDPLEKKFQDELQEKYSDIYNRIYKGRPECLKYENMYQKIPIFLGHVTVEEYVFSCLVRNPASNNIEEYFVSHEYYHPRKDLPDSFEAMVCGRFVFQRNERNEVVLLALAERPVERTHAINPKYCSLPNIDTNGRSKELCDKLPVVQRIRLCALLLNGKKYRGLARYTQTDNQDPECNETELAILCNGTTTRYKDFTVQCKADGIEPGSSSSVIRYISRGIKPYQFFVAQPIENGTESTISELFYSYFAKLEQPIEAISHFT